MERVTLGKSGFQASRLGLGCMGLGGGWDDNPPTEQDRVQAQALVEKALELGIDFIDHADIYTFGKAEEVFGQVLALQPGLRDRLVIQSKVGIRIGSRAGVRTGHYDLSPGWVRSSVEGILRRLRTDRLDILLLHRPDPLVEPEELAPVLEDLYRTGKVRAFGVSNMHAAHIRMLDSVLPGGICVNQVEASLGKRDFVEAGVTWNHSSRPQAHWFAEGTLEECRARNIRLQAWSPLAGGVYCTDRPQGAVTQGVLDRVRSLAEEKGVSREAVVLAWLLRHPAGFQPILGTTKTDRLDACAQALSVNLSREEWNSLWVEARGERLP